MHTTAAERIRARGLRATRPRIAVLDVLDSATGDRHLAAADVAERARAGLGALSTQAVYDCLEALTGAGLARRIEPAGHPARYESRVGDNHHHLVCRACGTTVDVDCVTGAAPCLDPSSTAGFTVDEAEVTFWGRCPSCRAGDGTPEPHDRPITPHHREDPR
ncbi:fur family transcriptional regulator FurA3 [Kineococcus sp. NUM-3379]